MRLSERLLEEIREDHRSGAVPLTLKAGEALLQLIRELEGGRRAEARLEEFAQRLIRAQPVMASIRNLAERALQAAKDESISEIPSAVEAFTRALTASTEEIARGASRLIEENAQLMTISRSTTVLETLKGAKRQGKRFSVICPESRPLLEGLLLAQELGKLGIPVELCADALAPSLVSRCDLVLVGGDALAPEGLVNKIGTYPLALAAQRDDVPVVALISTQKLLTRFNPEWIPEMDPSELWDRVQPMENVRVLNRYFDLTPLSLISRIVTERGIYTVEEIEEVLPR